MRTPPFAATRSRAISAPPIPVEARAVGVATTNYAACHNDAEAPIDVKNNGVFYLNSNTRYDDVTDGTSSTIFLGEKKLLNAPSLGWISGTNATLRNAGTQVNGPSTLGIAPGDEDDARPPPGGAPTPANLVVGGFSSFHSGGANFAFGDGSVRFLKNSMSPKVFRRLANRADGDLVSADQY